MLAAGKTASRAHSKAQARRLGAKTVAARDAREVCQPLVTERLHSVPTQEEVVVALTEVDSVQCKFLPVFFQKGW